MLVIGGWMEFELFIDIKGPLIFASKPSLVVGVAQS